MRSVNNVQNNVTVMHYLAKYVSFSNIVFTLREGGIGFGYEWCSHDLYVDLVLFTIH
jgi:hypothetical protein